VAFVVRVKSRAAREIEAAAQCRPAAPGAIRSDLKAAFELLSEQPGIGARVENSRHPDTRRLHLARTRYFVYYRTNGPFLDIVAFWHSSRGQEPKI
jgi:plasmid stabilization system protein ParE